MLIARVEPQRRVIHLVGDVVVVAWIVTWALLAQVIKQTMNHLAATAHRLGDDMGRLADRVDDAVSRLAEVPVVGNDLASPFAQIAPMVHRLTAQAAGQAQTLEVLAWPLFWVVFVLPTLTVALPYLPPRIRRSRETRQALRYFNTTADLNLFAMRAMHSAPMGALAGVGTDPVAAWRLGDPALIRRVADFELNRLGIEIVPDAATQHPVQGHNVGMSVE